mgnify:CR=1 FL=1
MEGLFGSLFVALGGPSSAQLADTLLAAVERLLLDEDTAAPAAKRSKIEGDWLRAFKEAWGGQEAVTQLKGESVPAMRKSATAIAMLGQFSSLLVNLPPVLANST